MEQLLTPTQAAELLQVSKATIYRMVERGDLKIFPGKGVTRIYAEQFEMPKEDLRKKRIWR